MKQSTKHFTLENFQSLIVDQFEKCNDFEMVMAGADGGLLNSAKSYAEKKGLKNIIHFPGFITHEQKLKYACNYDFYISTNRIDNAPVSLTEFMALGLVVVLGLGRERQ